MLQSAPSTPAIVVAGLVKRYGDLTAVDGISFAVADGDFFGFLGPNGAGKTTTINAIVALVKATSGSIEIFGHNHVTDWREARRLIGLAPQEYNFDRYLSIRDALIYQAGYYGIPKRAVAARTDELLERFGLAEKSGVEFTRLSGGMKRRLSLARALIHAPKLLILDEPTAGTDVELRIELWRYLQQLNTEGMTIFLTTHYLEEAEALCRNIGIIERGRLVALEPTADLLARRQENTLSIRLDRPPAELPAGLGALRVEWTPGEATMHINGLRPMQIAGALGAIERAGYAIEHVDVKHSTLQDVFLELTRR